MLMTLDAAAGQAGSEIRVTLTWLPITNVALLKTGLLTPVLTPLTLHWSVGVGPGLVGIAVNVTLVPAQIGPAGTGLIETEGAGKGFTTITTGGETALLVFTQTEFDVSETVITSPSARVDEM
jgi:hypothetical protein